MKRRLSDLWWWIRGVGVKDYRQFCSRCGRVGQLHWEFKGCWRYRA